MLHSGRAISSLSQGLNWVAAGSLMLMILLVCGNIITRLFGRPIMGTFELVRILLVTTIAFSLAYGSLMRCHTAVDLLMRRLSKRTQAVIDSITSLISLLLFALIAWRCFLLASKLWEAGEVSATLWIPHFPFLYGVAFNCILVCLVILLKDLPAYWKAMRK